MCAPANGFLSLLHGLEGDEAETAVLARLRILGQEAVGHGAEPLELSLQVLVPS